MQNPCIDDFSAWLGQDCEVASGAVRVPMTLLAAEPLAGSPRDAGGFRLEWRGPVDPVLAQAIMTVTRAAETYEIFMVPTARDAQGTRYEAVFY